MILTDDQRKALKGWGIVVYHEEGDDTFGVKLHLIDARTHRRFVARGDDVTMAFVSACMLVIGMAITPGSDRLDRLRIAIAYNAHVRDCLC